MSDELSCGHGLAAHATLPATLAAIAETMAGVLAGHQKSLDTGDPEAATEWRTYASLEKQYRAAAQLLQAISVAMKEANSLPPAPHDVAVLMNIENSEAFHRFIDAKRHAVTLLETSIADDEAMLET